jgi:hypothetical protein
MASVDCIQDNGIIIHKVSCGVLLFVLISHIFVVFFLVSWGGVKLSLLGTSATIWPIVNICSFVHQCNTFTSYILLIVDMFRPHTAIFKCYSKLSRSWCSVMPIFAYCIGLLYLPRMMDDDECGAVGRMNGRGNRSTCRKYAPLLFCPSQIPHNLTWVLARAAAVGSRRLTTWAMAQLHFCSNVLKPAPKLWAGRENRRKAERFNCSAARLVWPKRRGAA